MTWRWLTCSSWQVRLAAFVAFITAHSFGATVSGQIRLVQSADSTVKKRNDFSGVVVWLSSGGESMNDAPPKHAKMLQKDKKFQPHILAIQTGSLVDFPNLDLIFHNAFSNFNGQIFDVALYPPGTSRRVRFDRPGVVRVFCNIHPSMSAIIVVVNSSHFAVTDRDGTYTLPNVSRGPYELHFFHERATTETLAALAKPLQVNEATHVPPTTISEAGYLPVGHKNKYGQDYPPGSEDTGSYSLPLR